MTAPAWWVEWRLPTFTVWHRSTRPYGTREAAEDAQREFRNNGFEARLEEAV